MSIDWEKLKVNKDDFYAFLEGVDVATYKKNKLKKEALRKEAELYINQPPNKWPDISFNWDLSEAGQMYSLDAPFCEDSFKKYHPNGFCLGHIHLKELDCKLCHFSRRDHGELWQVGSSSKLSFLIAYLSKGLPISPPLVAPNSELKNEVILQGGHHRYAIAKEVGELIIPIHVNFKHKEAIDSLLPVSWV